MFCLVGTVLLFLWPGLGSTVCIPGELLDELSRCADTFLAALTSLSPPLVCHLMERGSAFPGHVGTPMLPVGRVEW